MDKKSIISGVVRAGVVTASLGYLATWCKQAPGRRVTMSIAYPANEVEWHGIIHENGNIIGEQTAESLDGLAALLVTTLGKL